MLYAIICTDQPDGLNLRQQTRPDHLAYLEKLGSMLKLAGPFLSDGAATPNGSLLIVDVGSMAEARAIADDDPYAKAGVFESVEIRAWKWLIGNPDAD